jgi:hypothetical protein
MRRRVLKCLILLAAVVVPVVAQYDSYGGWLKLKGQKTGFFHTERLDGRWWLVTPDGNVFFVKGVEAADLAPDANSSPQQAQTATAARFQELRGWGFNAVGDQQARVAGMPYTVNLELAWSAAREGSLPDYFSPEFREAVERRTAELCTRFAGDSLLLGYYTDTRIRWVPARWTPGASHDSVLEIFLKKAPESPGRQRAVAFMKARGRAPEDVRDDDRADFLEVAGAEYGRVCRDAIRRHDPNHLILGSSFSNLDRIELSKALAPYYDVFSYSPGGIRAPLYRLDAIALVTGKPTMVTDFTLGSVASPPDRADMFAAYVQDLAKLPTCVGFYWSRYRDLGAGPGGRGSDSAGVASGESKPSTVLVARATEVNASLEALAAKAGSLPAPSPAQYDAYGGWLKMKGRKTGFFHTEQIGGRWWLVTPEGNLFLEKGVEAVDLGADRNIALSPEDTKRLIEERSRQLRSWGFNTAASQRARLPGMAYEVTVGFASSSTPNMWVLGIVPDYFSPEFREAVDRRAKEVCAPLASDPWLIGYFTDNEIRWTPDVRSKDSVLEAFLQKPPGSAGYQKALGFLKERGRTPDTLTAEDTAAFMEIAAAEYGRVSVEAIRRFDKNHMILGTRTGTRPPAPLLRALGPYFDIFSVNDYSDRAPTYQLSEITRATGKPTMVTEFSFKAMDSGLYNTIGAGEPVATQQDRADLYAAYVHDLVYLPSCVGYHWFRYRDQPKEQPTDRKVVTPGGWGAENSNYGIVRMDGTPWTVLVNRMIEVNSTLETEALRAVRR